MRRELVYRDEIMDSLVKEYNRKRTNDGLKLTWIEKAVNDVKPAPIDLPDNNVGDIISRSSLLAKYDKEHEGPPGRARKLIEDEPPIQPRREERKIGEWIYDWGDWDFETCKCSECGNHMTTPIGKRYSFCPNCGAKMEVTE